MKKNNVNTFTEGLVCDLDPINVPNNVLTDCLNGTIITYDGNEYSLQNDKGNFPLSDCKLKPNYIPVGIKEHGGILYIVSYNPLTEMEEIGTYPSPKIKSVDSTGYAELNYVLETAFKDNNEVEYKDLLSKIKTIYFSDPDLKLNVGDSFQLTELETTNYESINSYIIDDNLQEHLVDDSWKFGDKYVSKNSGIVAVKNKIVEINSHEIITKSFICAEDTENEDKALAIISINDELNIDDSLLLSKISKGVFPIKYRVEVFANDDLIGESDLDFSSEESDESGNATFSSKRGVTQDWYGNNKTIAKNIKITVKNLSESVSIKITPLLVYNKDKYVIFSDLSKTLQFDLYNFISGGFAVAKNRYKFYNDDNNQYIELDVQGPLEANEDLDLYWTVYDGHDKKLFTSKPLGSVNIGINTITIPFDKTIKKESIYGVKFQLKCGSETVYDYDNDQDYKDKGEYRALITTELYNDLYSQEKNSDEISYSEWWDKFKLLDAGSCTINNPTKKGPLPDNKWQYFGEWTKNILTENKIFPNHVSKNSKLTTNQLTNSNIGSDAWLNGNYYQTEIKITYPKTLKGDLWQVTNNVVVKDYFNKQIGYYQESANGYAVATLSVPSGVGQNVRYTTTSAVVGRYKELLNLTTRSSSKDWVWQFDNDSAVPSSAPAQSYCRFGSVTDYNNGKPFNTIILNETKKKAEDDITADVKKSVNSYDLNSSTKADLREVTVFLWKMVSTLDTGSGAYIFKDKIDWDNTEESATIKDDGNVEYSLNNLCRSNDSGYVYGKLPDSIVHKLKKINADSNETFTDGYWVGIESGNTFDFRKLTLSFDFDVKVGLGCGMLFYHNCIKKDCLPGYTNKPKSFSARLRHSEEVDNDSDYATISDKISAINEQLETDKKKSQLIPEGSVGTKVKGVYNSSTKQYCHIGNISNNYALYDQIKTSGTPDHVYYLGRCVLDSSIWNPVKQFFGNVCFIAEYTDE